MTDDIGARDGQHEIAGRLALAVGRLNRRMITGGLGLSHGALSALSSLVKLGPLRLGDLAAQERIAAATTTRIVAGLEAKGLVRREVDPADRRSFVATATAAGTQLVLRARSVRADLITQLLSTLDDEAFARIVAAMPALESLVTVDIAHIGESSHGAGVE